MDRIDLHIHTTASDGSDSPSGVVLLAVSAGLKAIAITDHDTTSGYEEARNAAEGFPIEVIPGIEISTRYQGAVHILGYYVNRHHKGLRAELERIVQERDSRNEGICSLMRADGLPVDYSEMKNRFGEVIGRPHFARLLVELGLAADVQDAFRRYVEKGRRYYLPRHFLSIERSVEIIRLAGGVPVLAHPFQYRLQDSQLRELIEYCMQWGLSGIECFYSGYSDRQTSYLLQLAADYHLAVTGGSDYHGTPKPQIRMGTGTGNLEVPYSLIPALKQAAHRFADHD